MNNSNEEQTKQTIPVYLNKEDTIQKRIKEHKDEIERLEQNRKEMRIKNGKSIYCSKCKRFIEDPCVETFDTRICYSCEREIERQKQRKNMLDKLKGAKIINVDLTKYNSINSITFYKDKIMFEVMAKGDETESWFSLTESDARLYRDVEIELKPCDRPRIERPLEAFKKPNV